MANFLLTLSLEINGVISVIVSGVYRSHSVTVANSHLSHNLPGLHHGRHNGCAFICMQQPRAVRRPRVSTTHLVCFKALLQTVGAHQTAPLLLRRLNRWFAKERVFPSKTNKGYLAEAESVL